jgi:hypothetical protein
VTCEPVFGQHFLECFDAWRHVFELAPPKQGKLRERKDALPLLGKDDDLVLARCRRATPAREGIFVRASLRTIGFRP